MKAVIVEDEPLIADEMNATIRTIAPDVEVVAVLSGVQTGAKWFAANSEPDFILMDIKLSDGLSFELFEQVNLKCPVIFCTAYEEYAIKAFKVNGIDYLLKPVQEEELLKAINRIRELKQGETPFRGDMKSLLEFFFMAPGSKPRYKERFMVTSHNRLTPVETKTIAVIYRDVLLYFYKFSGDKIIYDYTPLEEIEEVLDPDIFFRANRQTIININAVNTIKPLTNQKLMVQLKAPLKLEVDISREKAPQFRKWMDK